MKGLQEVVSTLLISGILIGIVGSVYFWGVPLIQKNRDIATMKGAEEFMKSLDEKIKLVASNGGKNELKISSPGLIEFDGSNITLKIETDGIIYATEAEMPLGKNDCTITDGNWSIDEPSSLCVYSRKLDKKFFTEYSLKYIKLKTLSESYKIELNGKHQTGGEGHVISFENTGTSRVGDISKTVITISIL
ncbi:MAG: hypothetical protein V1802_02525 [Candidatus Aenigmatarchaeota archaeon]